MLIVNTASACGFTPQFAGLEQLHERFAKDGLVVLGFPCNQFGKQEPGDSATIADFCQSRYQISFPMFEKIDVNGANTHPLFACLKASAPGALGSKGIKWNFSKFLVRRDGTVYKRYGSLMTPETISRDIEKLLHLP